jgi:hypothetical protein
MKTRLIAPLGAVLCLLFIAAEPGQMVRNVKVSAGPTPFISFVNATVSDIAGFQFSQKRGRLRGRSRPAMGELIWKRGVISIHKMANSPFRFSASTPAAQTASQSTWVSTSDFGTTQDSLSISPRLPMTEARTPIQPSFSRCYQAPP